MSRRAQPIFNRREFLQYSGAAAVMVVGASGCGSSGNGEAGGSSYSGEVAVSHLTATLDGAPLVVAQEMGYLSEAGLDVELIPFSGGSDTVRGITQGGMAFGIPSTLAVVSSNAQTGSDLRFIAGNHNNAAVNFIVPEASPIQSVEDFRGKKVAVSRPGSLTTFFSDKMVRSIGLEPGKDVEIVFVGGPPDAWTAVTQGIVDVAWSAPPFSTALTIPGEARVVALARDYVDSWADSLLTTTQTYIDEQPDVLQNLVGAIGQAMTLIRDDPQRAAEAYGPAVQLDVDVARAALSEFPEAWSTEIPPDVVPQFVEAVSVLEGIDPDTVSADAFVDDQFVT